MILSIALSIIASATVVEKASSAWVHRRNATDRIAVLALAGSLNERVAEKRIFASFAQVFSSLSKIQPSFSSQDQASLAKVTRLGDTRICASRPAQGKKLQELCADVLFWLKLDLWEDVRGLLFGLAKLLIGRGPKRRGGGGANDIDVRKGKTITGAIGQ